MSVKQSFIFPVHNEEEILISQLIKFLKDIKHHIDDNFEIILIENGSKDRTALISAMLSKRFSKIKSYSLYFASYGQAIKKGIEVARGDQVFVLNIDYYDVDFIKKSSNLLPYLDIVIGSKTLSSSQDKRVLSRRLMTYFFNVFLRLVLNFPGTDTHGIKAFSNTALLQKTIKKCRTQNELFDTELVLRLTHHGALFVDLPQIVKEIRPSRYTGIRRLSSTLKDVMVALNSKYLGRRKFNTNFVDADDFGISDDVNKEILSQAQMGKINIISILSNLINQEAIDNLKQNNNIEYSLHFNLLRGKPLSDPDKVSSLTNINGEFYPLWIFTLRLFLGKISNSEIRLELWSQYKRLYDSGLDIKYINSEQHIHTFSPINDVIEKESIKMGIRSIRSIESSRNYLKNKPLRFVVFFLIRVILNIRYSLFREFGQKYHSYIVHPGTNYDK